MLLLLITPNAVVIIPARGLSSLYTSQNPPWNDCDLCKYLSPLTSNCKMTDNRRAGYAILGVPASNDQDFHLNQSFHYSAIHCYSVPLSFGHTLTETTHIYIYGQAQQYHMQYHGNDEVQQTWRISDTLYGSFSALCNNCYESANLY